MEHPDLKFLACVARFCWNLWKCGNGVCFEKLKPDTDMVIFYYLKEVSATDLSFLMPPDSIQHQYPSPRKVTLWSPSPACVIKINCDASKLDSVENADIGIVCRDQEANLVDGLALTRRCSLALQATAVLEAVDLAF